MFQVTVQRSSRTHGVLTIFGEMYALALFHFVRATTMLIFTLCSYTKRANDENGYEKCLFDALLTSFDSFHWFLVRWLCHKSDQNVECRWAYRQIRFRCACAMRTYDNWVGMKVSRIFIYLHIVLESASIIRTTGVASRWMWKIEWRQWVFSLKLHCSQTVEWVWLQTIQWVSNYAVEHLILHGKTI